MSLQLTRRGAILGGLGTLAVGGRASAQDKIVLKMGTLGSTEYFYYKGAKRMADEMASKSAGKVEIQVFPNQQLGNERDMIEGLQLGTLDLAVGFLPGLGRPVLRQPLFRDPYVCLMRRDHPIGKSLTRKKFIEASHVLVSYRGGHRVIEEALQRAGVARRIALRVPHFTVVPMVLERTDLILILPARVARVYERQGRFKFLAPPVPIPPADVGVHWHERFDADPGNRWLREQLLELFTDQSSRRG